MEDTLGICLQDLLPESRKVDIGGTWGDAYVWVLPQHNAIIIESRPAAQYIVCNRFLSPDVIKYLFRNIVYIIYKACIDELRGRIFCPIFDGARPLAEGLPHDVDQIILRCKRKHGSNGWGADGVIETEDITFGCRIYKSGRNRAKIKISILDECAASGSSIIWALKKVIEYCIVRAKEFRASGYDEVSVNINIVGIWFSQIAIERTREIYENFLDEWNKHSNNNPNINFEPLGPFVLSMGLPTLTTSSQIYGPETGIPLDHYDSYLSRKLKPIAHRVAQGSEFCGVGDVGLSIGNAKTNYKDGRPTHQFEGYYGHRAEAFGEAKFFGIDIKEDPWNTHLRGIWQLPSDSIFPAFQTFMKESRPELYEYYAGKFGSIIEPVVIPV